MPYMFETKKLLIQKQDDKRIKLTDGQKKIICELYKSGEYSQRALAYEFKVSRRLIQFIVCPDKLERNKELREDRGGSKQYYDKEKQKEYVKKHRRNKKVLHDENKLIERGN